MTGTTAQDQGLLQYLPAIYRAGAGPETPVGVVVAAAEALLADVEDKLAEASRQLDVATAWDRPEQPSDFLGWLADWVALDYGRPAAEPGQRALPADADYRTLVRHALNIHARRGTRNGLQYMLEVFCGAEVELLEWAWPQGFAIGGTGLGLNSMLSGVGDRGTCLVAVWHTPHGGKQPTTRGIDWHETWLGVDGGPRRLVLTAIRHDAAGAGALDEEARRLRAFLDAELPVHVNCYLAFDAGPVAAPESLPVLVVGTSSELDGCFLEVVPARPEPPGGPR